MTKRKLEPGQVWLARLDNDLVITGLDRPGAYMMLGDTFWRYSDDNALVCAFAIRRTFGVVPRKDEAILIDTRKPTYRCLTCRTWVRPDQTCKCRSMLLRDMDFAHHRHLVVDRLTLKQARKESENAKGR